MKTSRRGFIQSAAASAGLFVGGTAFPAILKNRSPNSMLSHACVGTGNMAWGDLNDLRSHPKTHITALCDVDSNYLDRAHKLHPDARIYRSWQEMLAKEGDKIDSVNVSTPDFTHAEIALAYMAQGKHVYVQKPMCHELADCRRLEKLAAEKHLVTQLGTQIASWPCDRQTVELIERGVIGRIKHVWLFTNSGGFARGERVWPLPADPVPATLDWKQWLGSAKPRAYSKGVYHPGSWRRWREFGSSWLGDMGSHIFSPVWLGMHLGKLGPTSVIAEAIDDNWSDEFKREFWPRMCHITWSFPGVKATGNQPFEMEWLDGDSDPNSGTPAQFLLPPEIQKLAAKTHFKTMPVQGRVIEGEDGWIISHHFGGVPGSSPEVVMKNGGKAPEVAKLPNVKSHYHEFLDCCFTGAETRSGMQWSARFTETLILGNMAQIQSGKRIVWNAEKGVIA